MADVLPELVHPSKTLRAHWFMYVCDVSGAARSPRGGDDHVPAEPSAGRWRLGSAHRISLHHVRHCHVVRVIAYPGRPCRRADDEAGTRVHSEQRWGGDGALMVQVLADRAGAA
eukprot:19273-Eustigmatos_ZCMA.PRE.1